MLADKDIQEVRNDLIKSGVNYMPLQDELVDHIISDTEKFMSAGKSFSSAYKEVKACVDFENVNFNEVQNDTKMLLDYKSRFLKGLMVLVSFITLIGFGFKLFKINGGSVIQLLSFLLLSVLSFMCECSRSYSVLNSSNSLDFLSSL